MFKRKRSVVEFYNDQTQFQHKKEKYISKQLEEKDKEIGKLRKQLFDAKSSRRKSSDRMKEIVPVNYEVYSRR